MLRDYLPLAFYGALALLFAGALAAAAEVFGRGIRAPGKASTYECGMPPVGEARGRINLRFYVVAVLFLLFDAEAAFLLPWAAVAREIGPTGFVSVAIFTGLLGVGLAAAWKKGALDWAR